MSVWICWLFVFLVLILAIVILFLMSDLCLPRWCIRINAVRKWLYLDRVMHLRETYPHTRN
jgi:hypothetical protein